MKLNPIPSLLCASLLAGISTGCAPRVALTTPEPLRVDIHMRLDMYQQGGPTTKQITYTELETQAIRRREARSGEIWAMKNDGVALEGEQGYLEVNLKSGWDAEYVNKLIAEENQDRRTIYEADARESTRPIKDIEEEAGKLFRQQTYVGSKDGKESKPASEPN